MNKYIHYFSYLVKSSLKLNFELSKPIPKKYLLIDGINNPLSNIFKKKDYKLYLF